MRKLMLDLDTLRVESFEMDVPRDERGTVQGAEATVNADCQTWESPWCGYQTYEVASCGGGCTGTGGTGSYNTSVHTCFYASCDGYTC
jgi:hypothetical protein